MGSTGLGSIRLCAPVDENRAGGGNATTLPVADRAAERPERASVLDTADRSRPRGAAVRRPALGAAVVAGHHGRPLRRTRRRVVPRAARGPVGRARPPGDPGRGGDPVHAAAQRRAVPRHGLGARPRHRRAQRHAGQHRGHAGQLPAHPRTGRHRGPHLLRWRGTAARSARPSRSTPSPGCCGPASRPWSPGWRCSASPTWPAGARSSPRAAPRWWRCRACWSGASARAGGGCSSRWCSPRRPGAHVRPAGVAVAGGHRPAGLAGRRHGHLVLDGHRRHGRHRPGRARPARGHRRRAGRCGRRARGRRGRRQRRRPGGVAGRPGAVRRSPASTGGTSPVGAAPTSPRATWRTSSSQPTT